MNDIIDIEKDKNLQTVNDLREGQFYGYRLEDCYATFFAVKKEGDKLLSMSLDIKQLELLGSTNLNDYIIQDNQVCFTNLKDFENTKLQNEELYTNIRELYEHHMTNGLIGNEATLFVAETDKEISEINFANLECELVYNSEDEQQTNEMVM